MIHLLHTKDSLKNTTGPGLEIQILTDFHQQPPLNNPKETLWPAAPPNLAHPPPARSIVWVRILWVTPDSSLHFLAPPLKVTTSWPPLHSALNLPCSMLSRPNYHRRQSQPPTAQWFFTMNKQQRSLKSTFWLSTSGQVEHVYFAKVPQVILMHTLH